MPENKFDVIAKELDAIINGERVVVSPQEVELMRKTILASEAMLIDLERAEDAGIDVVARVKSVLDTIDKATRIIEVYG